MKIFPIALASALAGALIVIACSDDSPGDADAAVCDCPAAEPPITTARLHTSFDVNTIAANAGASTLAVCGTNEILLNGGCEITLDNSAGKMVLVSSHSVAPSDTEPARGWSCSWRNDNGSGPADVRAIATCLQPAQ